MNEQELPDILDVEPPVAIPADPIHWAWWVSAILLLLGIIALVWWLRSRRQSAGISPKELALTRLESLHGEASAMDGYQFGVAVSDILRTYVTEAHGLRASQQTSREFLDELAREKRFNVKRQERLKEFLQTSDFLKYAPVGRATDPNRELLEQANFFIREDIA
ncbi:MAG: hypothetical protein ACI8T1_002640 [Verrucomicrobiales bacterium]|jgi:hypothetical protein